MLKYGKQWKSETMKECKLTGSRRLVLFTLVLIADFAGRSHRPYRELAKISGVSARSCAAALVYLTQAGFVLIQQRGTSHRPAWLKVVPYEKVTEPTLVQNTLNGCTKDFSSLVQPPCVAVSVNA